MPLNPNSTPKNSNTKDLPSWLFYESAESSSSNIEHTAISTSTIDINEFIHHQPEYWIKEGEQAELKKYKLLLADRTIPYWPSYRQARLAVVLEKLINAGFEIYVCTDESLEDSSKMEDITKTENKLNFPKKGKKEPFQQITVGFLYRNVIDSTLDYANTITKRLNFLDISIESQILAMCERSIAVKEEIKVIDYFTLKELMSFFGYLPESETKLFNLLDLHRLVDSYYSDLRFSLLSKILKESKVTVEGIINPYAFHTEGTLQRSSGPFRSRAFNLKPQLDNLKSTYRIINKYQYVSAEILRNEPKQKSENELANEIRLNEELEFVEIHGDVPLGVSLQSAKNIKSIKIKKDLNKSVLIEHSSLHPSTQLEYLEFEEVELSATLLVNFLGKCKELVTLIFDKVSMVGNVEIDEINLDALKVLSISADFNWGSSTSENVPLALLTKTKNIAALDYAVQSTYHSTCDLSEKNATALKHLTLKNLKAVSLFNEFSSKIPEKNPVYTIMKGLKYSSALEYMELRGGESFDPFINEGMAPNAFPKLRRLKAKIEASPIGVLKILEAAPNIEEFEFVEVNNKDAPFKLEDYQPLNVNVALERLNFISIDSLCPNLELLFAICKRSYNLKTIILTTWSNEDRGESADFKVNYLKSQALTPYFNLPHLENLKVNLRWAEFTPNFKLINHLIEQGKPQKRLSLKLEEFALRHFPAINQPLLKNLMYLALAGKQSDFTQDVLHILTNAPKLLYLAICKCKSLGEITIPSASNTSYPLQILRIKKSNFPVSFLLHILQKASNLKSVDVHKWGCGLQDFNHPDFFPYLHLFDGMEEIRFIGSADSDEEVSEREREYVDLESRMASSIPQSGDTDPALAPAYHLKRIFYAKNGEEDPAPNYYRIHVFSHTTVSEEPIGPHKAPFTKERMPKNLIKCTSVKWTSNIEEVIAARDSESGHSLYGIYDMVLSKTEVAIASWQPNEELTHIYIEGIKEDEVEITYCLNSHQYHLNSLSGKLKHVVVHFAIRFPPPLSILYAPTWLQKLSRTYNGFGVGKIDLKNYDTVDREGYLNFLDGKPLPLTATVNNSPTGWTNLAAIEENRLGACSHRSIAAERRFHLYLQPKGIAPESKLWIEESNCHAFIRVEENGKFFLICLGGYPAELTIEDHPQSSSKSLEFTEKKEEQQRLSNLSLDQLNPRYITWNSSSVIKENIIPFFRKLILENNRKKILLNCNNSQTIIDYLLAIQSICRNLKVPIYTVHSPKELKCAESWIQKCGNHGRLKKGPGGVLNQFLTTDHKPYPVVLINIDTFKANELVKHNSCFDPIRIMDGTKVHNSALVLALYNMGKTNAYLGSDLHSRLPIRFTLPNESNEITDLIKSIDSSFEAPPAAIASATINLFHSPHWKELLLGQWVLKGDELEFKPGKLLKSLQKGLTLNIQNGLWEFSDFQLFWRELSIKRELVVGGEGVLLPSMPKIIKTEGYPWDVYRAQIKLSTLYDSINSSIYLLNPTYFGNFTTNYLLVDNQLIAVEGWIKENKGKTLTAYMTRDISDSQWALLLHKCHKANVTLNLLLKPWHTYPKQLRIEPKNAAKAELCAPDRAVILKTSDVDMSVEMIKQRNKNAIVIDISECKASDILYKPDANWNEDRTKFKFSEKISDVWQALQRGETVVLKGQFSHEMEDSLAPILIENAQVQAVLKKSKNYGRLFIVTSQKEAFQYIRHEIEEVSPELKRKVLSGMYTIDLIEQLEKENKNIFSESFIKLQTMLNHLRAHPESKPKSTWHGLIDVRVDHHPNPTLDLSIEACLQFENKRYQQLRQGLTHSNHLIISGVTGVGKTTFVADLNNEPEYKVYFGLKQLKEFMLHEDKLTTPVLLMDEANIGINDYTQFEGLYQTPQGMLIEEKWYPRKSPKEPKLIFCCNPFNYGGGRHIPSFFERRGNVILFEPMPPAYLYHRILKPMLMTQFDEKISFEISSIFLEVYVKVCQIDTKEVLISPRELEMMVLSILSRNQSAELSLLEARKAAFAIGKSGLNAEQKEEFTQWFKEKYPEKSKNENDNNNAPIFKPFKVGNYLVTESRLEAYHQIVNLIRISQFQRRTNNKLLQYAGLGGFILESEPGEGKTELIINTLLEEGYEEGLVEGKPLTQQGKVFVKIPTNLPTKEKIERMELAFDNGWFIVRDETNSVGYQEEVANALLMGYTMDRKRPRMAGFKTLDAQNGTTRSGRQKTSQAIRRRCINEHLSRLSKDEMQEILQFKGLSEDEVEEEVEDYLDSLNYALSHHLEPEPNFRICTEVAEQRIEQNEMERKRKIEMAFIATDDIGEQYIRPFKRQNSEMVLTQFNRNRYTELGDEAEGEANESGGNGFDINIRENPEETTLRPTKKRLAT